MAEAIVRWVREDVAAAAVALGSTLEAIENYDSYDCRGRNRVAGARLSEHGRADALDVRSIKLGDGRVVELTDVHVPPGFRDALRRSACGRFTTVLGPGSDGYHETHIHLDLAERRSGYRICEWDVRLPPEPPGEDVTAGDRPPLPRSRPKEPIQPPVGVAPGAPTR